MATKMVSDPTNGAEEFIAMSQPYVAQIMLQGSCDMIYHRYNCEAQIAKQSALKNSKAKTTDDLETYVDRDDAGELCMPGSYVRGAVVNAARFKQDPRSPRKSASDLTKAGVIVLTQLASFGQKDWDYEDMRRAVVQRAAINRVRPALKQGWKVTVDVLVATPEYISPEWLHDVVSMAGRLVGVGDHRPTYGRFFIAAFETRPAA